MAAVEPPAKKPKTDGEEGDTAPVVEAEVAAAAQEAPKEPEVPKELEEDAVEVKKPKVITDTVTILGQDTTLNAMITPTGMLSALTDGGFHHLMAGVRANVGAKAGRHMFEVKIVQQMGPQFGHMKGQSKPQVLRIGVSTEASSLYAGVTEDSVCFDLDGGYTHNKTRTQACRRLGNPSVLAVVLNLDTKGPNANTISLFSDGVRVSQPQALPDSLKGKALYPTITYRNMTVYANFGSTVMEPLPFKCHMFQNADKANVVSTKAAPAAGKDGKFEALFPVGLPDEGVFDWADMFLKSHPDYTELSDRVILDMAENSGVRRARGYSALSAKDRPEMGFGIPELDDQSIRLVLQSVAPAQRRNFLVLELKGNLIKEERQEAALRFQSHAYTRVAHVIFGEPAPDFKKYTNELAVARKQKQADIEFRRKVNEEKRKKIIEKRQRELERTKKNQLKKQKRLEKERKRDVAAALKKKQEEIEKKKAEDEAEQKKTEDETGEKKEGDEEKKPEEETKVEEKKEEEPEEVSESEDEKASEPEEEKDDEQPPKVELTPEEKAVWFFKSEIPDMSPYVMNTSFTNFSLPEKDDGIDEVRFGWRKDKKQCAEFLKQWILDKKLTTRVEDIKPSVWFAGESAKWQKTLNDWRHKQNEHGHRLAKKAAAKAAAEQAKKIAAGRRAVAKAAKEAAAKRKEEEKLARAKQREEEAKKREEDRAAGKEVEEEKPEEKEEEEEEKPEEEDKEDDVMEVKEDDEPEVDFENFDVFGDEDICDIGGGMPLFKEFGHEDWAMATLRFELHVLIHAFRKDCNDPERTGIHVDHLGFYYQVYFKKALSPKFYGVETPLELVGLVNDTVYVTKQQIIEPQHDGEMEYFGIFARMTEEARRHRNLLLDLGDESARLKLQVSGDSWRQQEGGGKWGRQGNKGGGDRQQAWGGQGRNERQDGKPQWGQAKGGGAASLQPQWGQPKGGSGEDRPQWGQPKGGVGERPQWGQPKGGGGKSDQPSCGGGGKPQWGQPKGGGGAQQVPPPPQPQWGAQAKGGGGAIQSPWGQAKGGGGPAKGGGGGGFQQQSSFGKGDKGDKGGKFGGGAYGKSDKGGGVQVGGKSGGGYSAGGKSGGGYGNRGK